MRTKTYRSPRVKDLVKILSKMNQEAFVFISDGHESVNQMVVWDGLVPGDTKGNVDGDFVGYVTDPEDLDGDEDAPKYTCPAVQIDSGV